MSKRDLAKHIEALNLKSKSDFEITTKLEHWADYDIYTPEELDRYMLEQDYVGLYKDLYGIRARLDLSSMDDEMLHKAIDSMYDQLEAEMEDLRDFDHDELRDYVADEDEVDTLLEGDEWDEIQEDFDKILKVKNILH